GWVLREYSESGPDGRPYAFRWGRFLGNLFLNFVHLGLWFVAFGLVLRFQWSHALLLAIILWLGMSLAILPMLLGQAGAQSMERRGPAGRVVSGKWPEICSAPLIFLLITGH